MRRREFLAGGVAAATAGLAGCRSMFETRSARSPPLVSDRPDAVYYPTHVEGMQMVGSKRAGPFRVALTYSFPHRFWLLDVDETNKVEIQGSDSVHLMTTVWDPETGTVVPSRSVEATVEREGETVVDRRLWPMLSQNMGVHAGDNVALDGDGTYEVTVAVGPVSTRTSGGFRDRFAEGGSATFTLEFDRSAMDDIDFQRLPDQQGDRGAVDPMDMEMVPVPRAPEPADLPGTAFGTATSGDAEFAVAGTDRPAGVDDDGDRYLAVSPRTPYNGYPLPFMALSAELTRDGETVFSDSLTPTFGPDLGYHYGAVADPRDGDDLRVAVDGVPQLARHEGYETAFLSFDGVELTLSG
ncbi:MAG: iron transporter [Haloarculaceae archaeon]